LHYAPIRSRVNCIIKKEWDGKNDDLALCQIILELLKNLH